ncbi:MAG: hypothetical protein HN742_27920 [Lentisphaerae bacterium]|jgi:alpha-L-arabinofuranosidase|nr:hypothetical protein [Lentisphaerota bacterium]MBT4814734.1 hypothetical protein [Lentisphaerota bacterium]MBT5609859.1 hypothetical protein [Lentisphaerota bacterium]MBT7056522.1 hypothetical protein [Lentisphaerota bacterium]MBT7845732.1 hypothetical protein [Lentisphaerota bacterium]
MNTVTCFLTMALVTCVHAAQDVRIEIDPGRTVGPVNPLIFGNNQLGYDLAHGGHPENRMYAMNGGGLYLPDQHRLNPAMVRLAKEMGITIDRWPGGCGTHLHDWKRTIGPIGERRDWPFGLDEFMAWCDATGVTAVVTISYFVGAPQDAADMVEYLNASADGANPGGGVDWAAKRAANGHREPYGVRHFEFGNETWHGNHQDISSVAAADYARRYDRYHRAIKAVDPKAQLGILTMNSSATDQLSWTDQVLRTITTRPDFAIEHTYHPNYRANTGKPGADVMFTALLAAPDQVEAYYDRLHQTLTRILGYDLPLAITEYNASFIQAEPVPYRHSLGAALWNGEMLRIFSSPRHRILMANYWQFANSFWGQVKSEGGNAGTGRQFLRPNYFPYKLYHDYFQTHLIEGRIARCPIFSTEGFSGIEPARGKGSSVAGPIGPNLLEAVAWGFSEAPTVTHEVKDGVLHVTFPELTDMNYYHGKVTRIPVKPNTYYVAACEIRCKGLVDEGGKGLGLAIGDSRGYTVTKSQTVGPGAMGTTDWTPVEVVYHTLRDTEAVDILARRLGGTRYGTIQGEAWLRGLTFREYTPRFFPAPATVSVNASRSEDGGTLGIMLINRHLKQSADCVMTVLGSQVSGVSAQALTGPAIDAINEKDATTVGLKPIAVTANGHEIKLSLPPMSMAGLRVAVQR